ncbi:MAG: class I SAM-dependent methyltransferase [Halobacteriales archaeon]
MTTRGDVRATYDRIAGHFAEKRRQPWPAVESFISERAGAVGLDLGAGNGRHAELLADRADRVLGIDISRAALETAADRAGRKGYAIEVLQGDAAGLPLRTASIDLAVYIATLHHLPSRTLRVRSLDELARVLASDGEALVSAWSVSHETFDADAGFDTTVDWTLPDGETVPRYYHIYDLAEFEADLVASGLQPQDTFEAAGNCYGVVTSPERNAQ